MTQKCLEGVVNRKKKKASEEEKPMLKVETHPIPALDENRAGDGTEENGNRRMTSESTHIEQGLNFAIPLGLYFKRRCRNCPTSRLKMQQQQDHPLIIP